MRFLILVTMLLVGAQTQAAKIKVYKWIDDNGVVNFSQNRPAEQDYMEIEVEGHRMLGKSQTSLDYGPKTEKERNTKAVSKQLVAQMDQQAQEYCKKAKHNLKVLTSFDRVRVVDSDGNPKVLTDQEVMAERRSAKQQVEQFCKNS